MGFRATTFSAAVLVVIGLFGLILAFVPGISILEGIRPFLAIVGVVALVCAAVAYALASRGSRAN